MTTIQTFTGRMIDVANMQVTDIDLRDIARALSNICRFTGHTKRFYSVAEHSVFCACKVREFLSVPPGTDARTLTMYAEKMALLHDAHEAYLGDVSRPVKAAFGSKFLDMAGVIDWRIRDRFGLFTLTRTEDAQAVLEAVRAVDNAMLATERLQVFGRAMEGWDLPVPPIDGLELQFAGPESAEKMFLDAFGDVVLAETR